MRKTLRTLALLVLLGGLACWLGTGAHRGWTKTSVPTKIVDEVTGLEGIQYRRTLVPGVDFLGAVVVGAGLLAGASFLFRKSTINRRMSP